jgi:hypothetical protein
MITKLSGAMFMIFVLISAPFFAVQTQQDGINRFLSDDFIYNEFEINIPPGEALYEITYLNNTFHSISTDYGTQFNDAWSFTNKIQIQNNDIIFYGYENVTIIWFYDSDSDIIKTYRSNLAVETWPYQASRPSTWDNSLIPADAVYFAFSSIKIAQDSTGNKPDLISYATFETIEPAHSVGQTIVIPQNTYYDIMENARTADYQNVDSFTNIFYTIPAMASGVAEAYNRFINFTDNLNPFRVRDESTGEFRDQTPSEVMDSWPARIIVWVRRFTD